MRKTTDSVSRPHLRDLSRAIISAVACSMLLAMCDREKLPHQDMQVMASVRILRNLLGKPEGFKIMHADQYSDGAICYVYRARNEFGGFSDGVAVYDGDKQVSLGSLDISSYGMHCLGRKATRDVTDYSNYSLE
jgi:hypothetical protein